MNYDLTNPTIYFKDFDQYRTLKSILESPQYNPNTLMMFQGEMTPAWYIILTISSDPNLINYVLNDSRIVLNNEDLIYKNIAVIVDEKHDNQLTERISKGFPNYFGEKSYRFIFRSDQTGGMSGQIEGTSKRDAVVNLIKSQMLFRRYITEKYHKDRAIIVDMLLDPLDKNSALRERLYRHLDSLGIDAESEDDYILNIYGDTFNEIEKQILLTFFQNSKNYSFLIDTLWNSHLEQEYNELLENNLDLLADSIIAKRFININ